MNLGDISVPKLLVLVTLLSNGNPHQGINVILPDGTVLCEIDDIVKYSDWYVTSIHIGYESDDEDDRDNPIIFIEISDTIMVVSMPNLSNLDNKSEEGV